MFEDLNPLEQQLMARTESSPSAAPTVTRSRTNPDPVINKALAILNQDLNPVKAVNLDEIQRLYTAAGRNANDIWRAQHGKYIGGFRLPNDPHLYVNSDSNHYKDAANSEGAATILAGILAHEQAHESEYGTEDAERAVSRIESDFLRDQLSKLKYANRDKVAARLQTVDKRAANTKGNE